MLYDIIDVLGNFNEEILNQFFEGTLTLGMVKDEIILQANKGIIYPVLYGTALKGEGIKELLDGIIDYLPGPEDLDNSNLSALVYKISHNKTFGKIAHIKIFSGKVSTRDDILNVTTNKSEKITMIKKMIDQKIIDVASASSGDLVIVSGLNCSTYNVLGSKAHTPILHTITTPLLTLRIYSKFQEDNLDRILSQGTYGWPVTDLKITFVKGEDHVMHSRSGDFAASTAMGIMRGLNEIGTSLLEPIIKYRITVPLNVGGRVLNDVIKMHGSFDSPLIHNGTFTIEGIMYEMHYKKNHLKIFR